MDWYGTTNGSSVTMRSSRDVGVMAVVLLASASRSVAQSSSTTTAGVTMMTSASTLKLAASYTGNDFFNRFSASH